jgi:hypothetical protein
MFGNLKGWIIAAVLAGLMVMLTLKAISFNDITPVTAMASNPALLAQLKLDTDPSTLVPMAEAGDGTALYREAIKLVHSNRSIYKAYLNQTSTSIDNLPAVQKLVDAAPLAPSPILEADLDANIAYAFETPDLQDLTLAGQCLERAALLNQHSNPTLAKKLFEAELSLATKMFNERLTYREAFDAIGLLTGATQSLKSMASAAKDDQLADQFGALQESIDKVHKTTDTMWNVIGTIDPNTIALHAGDVYFFTTPAMKERMWRIESTLKLGRHKFGVDRLADAVAVPHRLDAMAKVEKDPAVLAAVKLAQNLTLTDYRSIRPLDQTE